MKYEEMSINPDSTMSVRRANLHRPPCTWSKYKLVPYALGKLVIDARVFTCLARRIRREALELVAMDVDE